MFRLHFHTHFIMHDDIMYHWYVRKRSNPVHLKLSSPGSDFIVHFSKYFFLFCVCVCVIIYLMSIHLSGCLFKRERIALAFSHHIAFTHSTRDRDQHFKYFLRRVKKEKEALREHKEEGEMNRPVWKQSWRRKKKSE